MITNVALFNSKVIHLGLVSFFANNFKLTTNEKTKNICPHLIKKKATSSRCGENRKALTQKGHGRKKDQKKQDLKTRQFIWMNFKVHK